MPQQSAHDPAATPTLNQKTFRQLRAVCLDTQMRMRPPPNHTPRRSGGFMAWDAELEHVVKRMRCSRCGERRCSVSIRSEKKRDG
jgi:hypothetical protein